MANEFARSLRENLTDAEYKLWGQLRGEQLKHKFRKQAPIGPYVADFVCFEKQLVVELDGGQHALSVAEDDARTSWLNAQGFRVLRFWNNVVFEDLEVVVETIARALDDPAFPPNPEFVTGFVPPPQPSATSGEGVNHPVETPFPSREAPEEALILAPPLKLSFQWDGARWRHRLLVGGELVAASAEWEPDRDEVDRVVSPSYQQIHCDERDGTQRAMLVGQWGPHHGSAAFVVSESNTGVSIDIDVAVRSHSPLAAFACTYTVNKNSSDLIDADSSAIGWRFEPQNGALWFETDGPSERAGLAEAGRRATRVQVERPIDPADATQRLRYRWRWQRGPN